MLLAVTFVRLALVVDSAAYTETLSTWDARLRERVVREGARWDASVAGRRVEVVLAARGLEAGMSGPWSDWDHIVKIDPDKTLPEGETFEDVCATGTDALEIGGTTGMTEAKMARVVEATAAHDIPVYIEPSNVASVVHQEGLDGCFVPIVLNAGDVFWTTGAHSLWAPVVQKTSPALSTIGTKQPSRPSWWTTEATLDGSM